MLNLIFSKLKSISPWHFIWITLISAEGLTAIMTVIVSVLGWGRISREHLIMGSINAFIVSLIIAPAAIYFIRHNTKLEEINEELQIEISERKLAEETLNRSARFLSTIFYSIRDPFIILDHELRIIKVNDAYAATKNIPASDLLGKKCYEVTRGNDRVCDECVVEKTFRSGGPCVKEKRTARPDGSEVWIEIYTYPILDEKKKVTHVIEYVRDVTERKKAEQDKKRLIDKLEFLSITDSLTGLLNRRVLIERFNLEIKRVKRYASEISLIFCDVDSFKVINDTYGHLSGDDVLKKISHILKTSVRTNDIVGRYGGDEFLMILPETSKKGAEDLAERIRSRVEEMSFTVAAGNSVRTTLSLGITHFAGGGAKLPDLISRIDNALYTSKRTGKNRVYTVS